MRSSAVLLKSGKADIQVYNVTRCYSGPEWLLVLLYRYPFEVLSNFFMVLWRAWNVRNGVLKAGETLSIEGSVILATCPALLQGNSGAHCPELGISLGRQDHRKVSTWVKPTGGVLKVNVDGAFHGLSGRAAVGVIVRDHDGIKGPSLGMASAVLLPRCRGSGIWCPAQEREPSPNNPEAMACLEGVRLSTRWPDASCVLESDCSAVVEKVNMKTPDRSIVSPIIGDIQIEMRQFSAFSC
ncbi:hypothetical protein EJB05_14327, partial [Eragrostis curvula]